MGWAEKRRDFIIWTWGQQVSDRGPVARMKSRSDEMQSHSREEGKGYRPTAVGRSGGLHALNYAVVG